MVPHESNFVEKKYTYAHPNDNAIALTGIVLIDCVIDQLFD